MKRILSAFLLIIMIFSLTACNKCDKENPISKRYTDDRSSQMPDIPISDEKFTAYLSNKVIPLCDSVYTLSIQAQQLKAGTGNIENEIKRVDNISTDIQKIREDLMGMNVNENKKEQKQSIMDSLNNLDIQLSSYKTLLSSKSLTKTDIQNTIDAIMGALDSVKQYAK